MQKIISRKVPKEIVVDESAEASTHHHYSALALEAEAMIMGVSCTKWFLKNNELLLLLLLLLALLSFVIIGAHCCLRGVGYFVVSSFCYGLLMESVT